MALSAIPSFDDSTPLSAWQRRVGAALTVGVTVAVVVALPPPLALTVILGVIAAGVLLARPTLTVYALVFSVPYESLRAVSLGGLNAGSTEFILFCGGLAYCMNVVLARRDVPWAWWRNALLIFAGVMVISVTQALEVKSSLKELLKLGEMLLTYLLVLAYIGSPSPGTTPTAKLRRLLTLVVLAAASQGLLGILQTVAHFGPASFARGGVLRGSGTFDQPNPFAGYLNLTLPLLVAAVIGKVELVGRLTRPILLILAVSLLLSLSRGALLAELIAIAVMVLIALPQARPFVGLAVVAAVIAAVGAAVGLVPSSLTDSVTGIFGLANIDVANPTPFNWAVAERLAHVEAGVSMFLDHPLLGVGIGNYPAAYTHYHIATTGDIWANPLGHAHNYYVNVAAEAGVVGLGAFLLLLLTAFRIAHRLYHRAEAPQARILALGTIGVLTTVAIHSLFDDIFVHAMEAQLALVMGMATVACRLSVEQRQEA